MKLSTAIRIGSMTTKQIKGAAWDGDNGYCALGAALSAVNVAPKLLEWDRQVREKFAISEALTMNPADPTSFVQQLIDVIWKLNDNAGWTREAIADFVEQVEIKEESKQQLQSQEAVLHE